MTGEYPFSPVRVARAWREGSAFALTWRREFDFRAGQLVEAALSKAGSSRLYSLFTGPGESEAGILFNLVDGGELSPSLARLAAGDELWIGGPSGTFPSLDGPGVWIANGTGVAPFVSMARAGLCAGKRLIHGARASEDFYFQEELGATMGEGYLRCCSGKPSAARQATSLYLGRLTSYLEGETWDPGMSYQLCGSAPMVVDVRDILISKGVPHSRIVSEVYF